MPRSSRHAPLFWGIGGAVLVTDLLTKDMAAARLLPPYLPHDVWGSVVRLTLVYNPGAAFGLHVGAQSRWIFSALAVGALVVLWRMFRATRADDLRRVVALGLVCGGAVGNLVDRMRSVRGVVDFIDIGIGGSRWPTFNVADIAVTCGAILLAAVLWREDAAVPAQEPVHGHDTPVIS